MVTTDLYTFKVALCCFAVEVGGAPPVAAWDDGSRRARREHRQSRCAPQFYRAFPFPSLLVAAAQLSRVRPNHPLWDILQSVSHWGYSKLKPWQNKNDLNDVTAALFSVSFSQLPAAKQKHRKRGRCDVIKVVLILSGLKSWVQFLLFFPDTNTVNLVSIASEELLTLGWVPGPGWQGKKGWSWIKKYISIWKNCRKW